MVEMADGADVAILRTTEALAGVQAARREAGIRAGGRAGHRRPVDPTCPIPSSCPGAGILQKRTAPPARSRTPRCPGVTGSEGWKFGFNASRCQVCGFRHLPPTRVCLSCQAVDQMVPERMADIRGTVATYTIDRLAFSLSPPMVGAVIDFDGGGRYRGEMTDVDPGRRRRRHQGGDDLSAPLQRRGCTQLLLEGPSDPRRPRGRTWPSRRRRRAEDMTSTGIRDRVAIVGMGCTPFGELWDKGVNDLLTDAVVECVGSAGVAMDAIDAFWLGTLGSGNSGHHPVQAPEDRLQAGHPGGEFLCHRLRGLPQRLLRGGLGRLRAGHGHRRREAEGLRLLGPDRDPQGRATAPTPN